MNILALADDMTGALEVGAKFSAAGVSSIVSVDPIPVGSAFVVVLDTETRHLDAQSARQQIARFVQASALQTPAFIYKKTDSTLRGNIGAELGALAALFPQWCVGYAPAYPAMGRTVIEGHLFVHGVRVSETEFARDALNPVRSSSVAALLDQDLECCVFDGELDCHLVEAAKSILSDPRMRIVAGPAGLAQVLAMAVDLPRTAPPLRQAVLRCLILNGSRHAASREQVRTLETDRWRMVHDTVESGMEPLEFAAANARMLLRHITGEDPDGVLVIGGDTAFAVVRALGSPALYPVKEVVAGVPITRIKWQDLQQVLPGRDRDLMLITKAGGFGDRDILNQVRAKLTDGE